MRLTAAAAAAAAAAVRSDRESGRDHDRKRLLRGGMRGSHLRRPPPPRPDTDRHGGDDDDDDDHDGDGVRLPGVLPTTATATNSSPRNVGLGRNVTDRARGGGESNTARDSESTITLASSGAEDEFASPSALNAFSTARVGQTVTQPVQTSSSGYDSRERPGRSTPSHMFERTWIPPERQSAHIAATATEHRRAAAAAAAEKRKAAGTTTTTTTTTSGGAPTLPPPPPPSTTTAVAGTSIGAGLSIVGKRQQKQRFSMQRTVDEIRRRTMDLLGRPTLFTSKARVKRVVQEATAAAMAARAAGVAQDGSQPIDVDPASEERMDAAVMTLVEMEEEALEAREQRSQRRRPASRPAAAVPPPPARAGTKTRVVRKLDDRDPPPPPPKRIRFTQGDKRKRDGNQPGTSRKKVRVRRRVTDEDDGDDDNDDDDDGHVTDDDDDDDV